MASERLKRKTRGRKYDVRPRDRATRSSVEVAVMVMERKGRLIALCIPANCVSRRTGEVGQSHSTFPRLSSGRIRACTIRALGSSGHGLATWWCTGGRCGERERRPLRQREHTIPVDVPGVRGYRRDAEAPPSTTPRPGRPPFRPSRPSSMRSTSLGRPVWRGFSPLPRQNRRGCGERGACVGDPRNSSSPLLARHGPLEHAAS